MIEDICAMDDQSASFSGSVKATKSSHHPTLDELISVTCAVIGLEPSEFEQQPKKRKCVTARQLIVWLWVRRYRGKQIEVARRLNTSTAAVSKWYSRAVLKIVELKKIADDITSKLPSMLSGETVKANVVYGFKDTS